MKRPPFDHALSVETPAGVLTIRQHESAITSLEWGGAGADQTPILREAVSQLEAYFGGGLEKFDLPLVVHGSDAQRKACTAMLKIPFGETRTYGDLAKDIGVSAQAMGQLCGGNPIPILIPCHRVLGASGLGGFSGGTGVEDKVFLLRHEGAAGLLI